MGPSPQLLSWQTQIPSVSWDMLGGAVSPPIPSALPALKCLGRRLDARRAGVPVRRLPPASPSIMLHWPPRSPLRLPGPLPPCPRRELAQGSHRLGPGERAGHGQLAAGWIPQRGPLGLLAVRASAVCLCLCTCVHPSVCARSLCSCLELTRTSPCALASMGLSA